VGVAEGADRRGQRVEARGVDHAHAQRAGAAFGVVVEPVAERARPGERLAREARDLAAGLGELAAAAVALQQRHAEPALQLRQRLRERGLAHLQASCRLGERAPAFERAYVGELLEVEVERRFVEVAVPSGKLGGGLRDGVEVGSGGAGGHGSS